MAEEHSGAGSAEIAIAAEEAGQRIDNWLLRRLKGWPRSQVYRLLRSGQVRINSGRIRPDYRLSAGDRLRLPPQARGQDTAREGARVPPPGLKAAIRDSVLFEDDRLLVLDKPAGVAAHGGSGVTFGVIEVLRSLRPDAPFLELVHRLDRETSGCLVLAKRRSALRELHRQFREGEVEKRYLALVAGDWQRGEDRLELGLETGRRRNGERHVQVAEHGKPAVTRFRLVEAHRIASLLEVMPETGRTHQIRVHAQAVGHPLAGDERYGDEDFNHRLGTLGLKRLFLHAHMLTFRHPVTGEPCAQSTPLPDDLRAVLDRLPRR